MITLLTDAISPRLQWIADILLGRLLGQEYRIQTPREGMPEPDQGILISYTSVPSGSLHVQPEGLLLEPLIRKERITWESLDRSQDLFAQAFWLLSDYGQWQDRRDLPGQSPLRDPHDRYLGEDLSFPSLGDISEKLERLIREQHPDFRAKKPGFDFEITLDVDRPWKFRHKGAAVLYGGLIKDLLRGDLATAGERVRTILGKKDPFYVYDELAERLPRKKTRFFFLVGGEHPHDSRFDIGQAPYRQLIQKLTDQLGFATGLHPSYACYRDPQKMQKEKASLEAICGPIHHSRQHFLRYSLPETFRALESAGIRHEYSLGPFGHPERRFPPLLLPYLWYDLGEERISELTLHPAALMDRPQLPAYRRDPEAPFRIMRERAEKLRQQGGKFIMILHNETFSDSGEWRGWQEPLLSFIDDLSHGR